MDCGGMPSHSERTPVSVAPRALNDSAAALTDASRVHTHSNFWTASELLASSRQPFGAAAIPSPVPVAVRNSDDKSAPRRELKVSGYQGRWGLYGKTLQ